MTLMVETQSGSSYEFTDDMTSFRRKAGEGAADLRRDGEWLTCDEPSVQVGIGMEVIVKGLVDEPGFTVRRTTPVTAIWHMDDSLSE